MGLDIELCRPIPPDPQNRFYLFTRDTPLESKFKDFIYEDLEGSASRTGYTKGLKGTPRINYEVLSYQKGGANISFFSNDWRNESRIVVEKDILLEHWKVLFNTSDYFLENIVSKFKEGKTFVIYD